MCQRDHGRDQGHRAGLGEHRVHESAVDFERLDGKLRQVAQRRIAGAEVVHRNPHAEFAHLLQAHDIAFDVVHDQALGDFEVHARDAAAEFNGLAHGGLKVGAPQLNCRHVDRHTRHSGQTHLAPARMVAHRLLHGPGTHLHDQPCLLQQRNKPDRRHQPLLGVLPADQCLHAQHLPGIAVHLGLVMQDELLLADGATQLVLKRQRAGNLFRHVL